MSPRGNLVSGWICRMRGGVVNHTIMISLPLLRGACSSTSIQYFKITGFVPESPIFSSLQFFRFLSMYYQIHPPSPSKFTPFSFGGFSSYEDILYFTTRCDLFREQIWVIIEFRSSQLRTSQMGNKWKKPIHPVILSTCSCFTTGKDAKSWSSWFKRMCCQLIFSLSIFCRSFSGTRVPLRRRESFVGKYGSTPQICTTLDHTHAHFLMSRWPPKNMQFCRTHQSKSP